MDIAVQCYELSKVYAQGDHEVHALSKIDLEIPSGSFLSLCGPSGSGKTTLLNLIGGLDSPTSGEIFVGDKAVHKMSSAERARLRLNRVGFVFQAYNLIPVLSAAENVEFVMQLQGIAAEVRREKSHEILSDVGLEGLEQRRPGELSGGQQQRVAVARAIVSDPELILADEPTANLDSKTASGLMDLMARMNEERKATFVFSTHDSLVIEFAKRVVELHDGRITKDSAV